jgi:ABC-type sugar transport system ATPase subunit
VSLAIADGEIVALVGPSGCGKTTLLRLIAGLERPTQGEIRIAGKDVAGTPPRARNVAFAFQDPALYPQLTVYENLAAARKSARARRETDPELVELADDWEIGDSARLPGELSGGERQRAALARTLARPAAMVLLDEPLSHIDTPERERLRRTLRKMLKDGAVTTVYVTHDQLEAMAVAERLVVLRDGMVQQIGTAREIYDQPANLFVAGFFGSQLSQLSGTLDSSGPKPVFRTNAWCIEESALADDRMNGNYWPARNKLVLGIRPEDVRLAADGAGGVAGAARWSAALAARVVDIEWRGDRKLIWLRAADGSESDAAVELRDSKGTHETESAPNAAAVNWLKNRLSMFVDAASSTEIGDEVRIEVDLRRVHWFDERTGSNVTPASRPLTHEPDANSPGG